MLTTIKIPKLPQQETAPIKAYMITVPANTKPLPVTEKPQQPIPSKPKQQIEATSPKPKTVTTPISPSVKIIQQKKSPLSATDEKTNNYKKIDLKLGLEHILKEQQTTLPATQSQSNTSTQPLRITVPKAHQANSIDPLKIEKRSMQLSIYRYGDKCFKKVSMGAGVILKSDLPESYIQAIDCTNTKVTEAYDQAMDKWLNKK
ncbi:hypothetical protein [Pseudoalteromonas arctica]|nr:hypothetical protein [Pseudoalteromonas arctica]